MALPVESGDAYVRKILSDHCWNRWSNAMFKGIPHLQLDEKDLRGDGKISTGWYLLSQFYAHGNNSSQERRQRWIQRQKEATLKGKHLGNAAPLALLRNANFSKAVDSQWKLLGEVVIVELVWGWYIGRVKSANVIDSGQHRGDAIYRVVVEKGRGEVYCLSSEMGKLGPSAAFNPLLGRVRSYRY